MFKTAESVRERRLSFVGGSDARIIMGSDEAALIRLWREKRGEIAPQDLSGNLIVQLGKATEELNRTWYERNTGRTVRDIQSFVRHSGLRWMAATVDGIVDGLEAVFESKFMLPWSFSEGTAAEKYMPQLQHNMWVTHRKRSVLSIITGGGKWVELSIPMDPLYLTVLVSAEKKFWRCVQSGDTPHLVNAEPPRPRFEVLRIVDMSSSNSWAEFAALFRNTRGAFLDHERAKTELKALMPEDAKEAIGHGVRGRRTKSGAVWFDISERETGHAASSDSIAALASALAKAQAQLVNPEKTLTAVLRPSWAGERERTFRYAPLSSGLDIVRKILGEHEIATIQSTAIDQGSGLVNLTTTLAHASGEWIASVWPICPVAELATPQRMGAALTYARRYALFTLVGIAGEDDLDAPDLLSTASRSQAGSAEPRQPVANSWGIGRPSGSRTPGNGRLGGPTHRSAAILKAELSASLRERLVEQVIALGTRTAATKWAATALAAKNSLTADDAKALEEAFEQKLSEFAVSEAEESSLELRRHNRVEPTSSGSPQTARKRKRVRSGRIDKSVLSITAAKRHRNKEHLRYVAQQPCLVCGRKPCDPHHLRFTQPRALGNKVSDEFTVPLCRAHHRAAHKAGDEREWWQNAGVDPMSVAKRLWDDTRSQPVSVMCSGSDPKDASHTTIHP